MSSNTAFSRICGRYTVPTSMRSTTRYGASSRSVSVGNLADHPRNIFLNITENPEKNTFGSVFRFCSKETEQQQQTSNVFHTVVQRGFQEMAISIIFIFSIIHCKKIDTTFFETQCMKIMIMICSFSRWIVESPKMSIWQGGSKPVTSDIPPYADKH